MRLILYRDPACAPPASYRLGIAWRETLWTTLMHYRLVLVAWPVAVALLILREQSKMFMRTGGYLVPLSYPQSYFRQERCQHSSLHYWSSLGNNYPTGVSQHIPWLFCKLSPSKLFLELHGFAIRFWATTDQSLQCLYRCFSF